MKTLTFEVKCHACPARLALTVSDTIWREAEQKRCADRSAELILGFTITDKGPACWRHT